MIFACLARRAAHLARTCMFDMSSMAEGTTSTVSDGETERGRERLCKVAALSRPRARFVEGGRKFWVLPQTVLSPLPSSFLPIISSLVKKCNYFSSKVFSNERSPTRPTDGRATPRQTGRPSQPRARGSTTHARKEDRSVAATDKSHPCASLPK